MSVGFSNFGYNTARGVARRCSAGSTRAYSSQRLFASAAVQQSQVANTAPKNGMLDMGTCADRPVETSTRMTGHRDIRMRFAEPTSDSLNVGFTDGSQYSFPASWLRSVSASGLSAQDDGPEARISSSALRQGAAAVTLQWGQDKEKSSNFGVNMLRSSAEKVAQALPEGTLLDTPYQGAGVWTGEDLAKCPSWGLMLSDMDIQDLKRATKEAAKTVEWRAPGVPEVFPKDNFPLSDVMSRKLEGIADELEYGKGLAMIRNMPVDDPELTEEDLAIMYIGISAHIGHVVMQSSSGLRSVSRGYGMPLGRIIAEMTGETPKAGKQTNNHFRFHTDRCDVISLMCIRAAPTGGASRVCSAPAVYNAILKQSPELARALLDPIDRIWEGEKGYFRLPVMGITPSGQFTTQISPSYVENAQFLEGAAKATPTQIAALDAMESLGMDLGAEYIMKPGMLSFLNNHQVYHGRGNWGVTSGEVGGNWGNEGRLLLRTWISPYNSRPVPDTKEYRTVWGSVEGGKPRGGWDQAVSTGEVPKAVMPDDHIYYSLYDNAVQKHSMNGHCGTVLEY